MAHNFRLPGRSAYLSKAGSDSNPGTPDQPFLTLAMITSAYAAIGTGTYRATPGTAYLVNGDNVNWQADGKVILIGDAQTQHQIGPNQGGYMAGLYYDKFAGFHFHGYYGGVNQWEKCILKVISENASQVNSYGTNDTFRNCILINVNGGSAQWKFYNCLFFNCTISTADTVDHCYIDPTSSITTSTATVCNVDPRCQTASSYGLRTSSSNGAFGYTSQGGIPPTLPGFNSLAREDWSLRKDSPHIQQGIGPIQYRYSNTVFLEFTGTPGDPCTTTNTQLRFASSLAVVRLKSITASPDALTFNAQGGVVRIANSNGNGFSQFVTQRIPFSDISQEVTVINMFAGLNFDTNAVAQESQISLAAPSPYNNNVPDYNNWSTGSAGRNPNRLTYRARWSTLIDPDVDNPSHWVSGASFIDFEWGTKPTWIQSQLMGNGRPEFNPNDPGVSNIVARFLQIEVTIRDDYFSK